jgi:DNA methyltransferase 1-associated protein 1
MPTRDNILYLESLIDATTALVETKKFVDKMDYDIRVLKGRLGMSDGQGDGGGDEMAIDDGGDEEPVGDDGRAQSVLSARSAGARNRKHVSLGFLIAIRVQSFQSLNISTGSALDVHLFCRYV